MAEIVYLSAKSCSYIDKDNYNHLWIVIVGNNWHRARGAVEMNPTVLVAL
jgi:hypothetical protein